MGDESSDDRETPDQRTIRLLGEEIMLLRRRVAEADEGHRRLEAIADAATARFAEQRHSLDEEIVLLRTRIAHSDERRSGLEAEFDLARERFAERGDLLHEVNHRAKNSIQLAMSVLNLQRQSSDDSQVRMALAGAIERLGHVARVHSMLYGHGPDQQTIDFGDYLRAFCAELRDALGGDVDVVCGADDGLDLDAARAINLALITSEAVTNALKHAFPDGGVGTISVECRRRDDGAMLLVSDTGIGMTATTRDNSLGLKLIRTLAKGIGGTLQIDSDQGTRLQVGFPL